MDRFILAQLTQLYLTLRLECPFYEVKREWFILHLQELRCVLKYSFKKKKNYILVWNAAFLKKIGK